MSDPKPYLSATADADTAALHAELWDGLYVLGSPAAFAPGAILFREGDPVLGLYLLENGSVRLSIGKNRRSLTYRVVSPKYILGLPATLLHRPYTLSAEAVSESQVRFIDADTAMDYFRMHADMCMHVLEFLSHEMVWIRHVHAAQLGEGRPL